MRRLTPAPPNLFTWKSSQTMESTATKLHRAGEVCDKQAIQVPRKVVFPLPKGWSKESDWFLIVFNRWGEAYCPSAICFSTFRVLLQLLSLLIIFFNYVTWSAPSSLFTVQLCGINHLCFSQKNIFGGGDSQLRVQKSMTYLMVLPQKMISLAHGYICLVHACVIVKVSLCA